jgi:hypothetical protein
MGDTLLAPGKLVDGRAEHDHDERGEGVTHYSRSGSRLPGPCGWSGNGGGKCV